MRWGAGRGRGRRISCAASDGLPLLVEELFAGLVEARMVARDGERWSALGPFGFGCRGRSRNSSDAG